MSMKDTVRRQYQARIDSAAREPAYALDVPKEGWIATMRKALGMSGAQLARRMGQTRSNISKNERTERSGGISLNVMSEIAEAMGCKFVYAMVPKNGSVSDLIEMQARKKARAIVERASTHMALEKQQLTVEQQGNELERLTRELMREMSSDFWEDK